MDRERTRRAVLGALLAGGVAGAAGTPIRRYLDRFAPFSGALWDTAGDELPEAVESPYGAATVRYDDHGVPHVSADDERALYFAVGYVQGADRLFQMDLQRRQMRGELSAVVGEATLDSDRFHVAMDFAGAAETTWNRLEGSETGDLVEAYTEGVNRHVGGDRPLPAEYDLLGFEPRLWKPADAMLAEKQIGWTLTGSFRTLRRETVRAAGIEGLYPSRLDHDAAILGHEAGDAAESRAQRTTAPSGTDQQRATHPDLESWLSGFESPPGVGSNSWVVSGEHTASGAPLLANDPHLSLMAPPVWYEMGLDGPETTVRGVTFPGVPFVVIGENDGGAWGFTNAGADVIDCYEYETRDGQYRYGDEWRDFETEERTIEVADGDDRTVTVRKTVHGPVLSAEADGDELRTEVGVAWTGLGATRTTEAVRDLNRSDGLEDALAALERFDLPTQNCVYADREGNTHYRVVGKVPIRRTDGEQVPGDRVFDGSAKEGEWAGYTPYGETDWTGEGFVPFAEMPHADQPGYLGTANQRVVDDADYPYYVAESYGDPFRGIRLWDRLDRRIGSDEPADPAFMRDLQRDTYDARAAQFVPVMQEAASAVDGDAAALLADLDGWDYRMDRDSRAALVFARFVDHYRDVVFEPRLAEALGDRRDVSEYYGGDWVLLGLDPDSAWFPDGRDAAIAEALARTATELDEHGWATYGDYNTTAVDHPFDRPWLNYPRYPTDGSPASLNNFRHEESVGSSWRMICPMDKSAAGSRGAFPGGNDGSVFSEHYHDQLRAWADGEYKSIPLGTNGEIAVRFEEGER
ncbi:penicillin acylase family protein [Halorientalis pallida]|uniref:Penicillin acylase family protein n=1 Tax=Halorientalis pallida TaxID=2479928 RepID=A0A498KXI7_9EURY|nr:penicillin acylase family protein [Halorientalis pallida]RXK50332.1 penicillin acylase family protein [Halorientalis pallida]